MGKSLALQESNEYRSAPARAAASRGRDTRRSPLSDQSTETHDYDALQAEFLDLLEQDRALHAKLAEVAGALIVQRAQEGVLALEGRREVADALGVEGES